MRRALLLALLVATGRVGAADRPMRLDEAIALALEKNEAILVERESLGAAEAAVSGARGAYDPLLGTNTEWRRATEPANTPFSGAPPGRPAATIESTGASVSLQQLLPTGGSVEVLAGASRDETDGSFTLLSPAYDTRLGVEVRQPLLRNRTLDAARFNVRVAASDREGAVASLRSIVTDTVAAVERTYWTLTAARLEVGVREEAVRLAEEQLADTRNRMESGLVPETEISQPRAELERRRGELLASAEAASRTENLLKLLILGDAADPSWHERLVPTEDVATPVVPFDVETSVTRALSERPEVALAEATLERRRTETAFAADGVRPALDAYVSYDRIGLAGSQNPASAAIPGLPAPPIPSRFEGGLGRSFAVLGDGDFDDTRAGLTFSIPLGNRAAKAAAARAGHFERQAENELSRVRKTIRAEVQDAAAALETRGQRIEAAHAGLEAAQVQLAAEQDRYAVGLSTNFLVLTRQNDLSRARLDEIDALTDYRVARTGMARATGALLAEHGIQVDTAR